MGVETVDETVDSGNESSSGSSRDGDITSVMPSESLNVSCWILPDSREFTIRKATVPFNLLWGSQSITCLRPQILKKHKDKIKVAIRLVRKEKVPGVVIKGIVFEPVAFQKQKIGFSAPLRL